jgi:hypothetical protein
MHVATVVFPEPETPITTTVIVLVGDSSFGTAFSSTALENGDPPTMIVASVHRFRINAESVHRDRDLAQH